MPNIPQLIPESQFPQKALDASKQVYPKVDASSIPNNGWQTWTIASSSDSILPWGKNVLKRDQQLRDFWPTETFLAGALASVCFNRASLDWEIRHPSEKVAQAVTDMLKSAIAGSEIG